MERGADGGAEGEVIRFTASTEEVARDGIIIEAAGWKLDNYRKNPVVLWAHDYFGRNLPIGRSEKVAIEDKTMVADIKFDQGDEFAKQVERKYRAGFLNAVSVGWNTLAIKPSKAGEAPKITEAELLDISAVPVPGDPDALMERELRGLQEILMGGEEGGRSTIDPLLRPNREGRPYPNEHACRLRDPGDFEADSFRRTERDHEGKKYSVIMGKLKGESTMTEQAYRYAKDVWTASEAKAHCKDHNGINFEPAKSESAEAVWNGIASAMLALFRESIAMEEETRKAVYILLERAYGKLGRVAPEYRSQSELMGLGCEEIEGLFLEGEVLRAKQESTSIAPTTPLQRVGAVLNTRNRGDLEDAVTLVQGVLQRATKEENGGEGGDGQNMGEGEGRSISKDEMLSPQQRLQEILNRLNKIGG